MGHSRWLADQIPGAIAVWQLRAAHFTAFRVLPDILTWLLTGWRARSTEGHPAYGSRSR